MIEHILVNVNACVRLKTQIVYLQRLNVLGRDFKTHLFAVGH